MASVPPLHVGHTPYHIHVCWLILTSFHNCQSWEGGKEDSHFTGLNLFTGKVHLLVHRLSSLVLHTEYPLYISLPRGIKNALPIKLLVYK